MFQLRKPILSCSLVGDKEALFDKSLGEIGLSKQLKLSSVARGGGQEDGALKVCLKEIKLLRRQLLIKVK